ncbi:MAG: hypothetical protein RLZZ367_338 [Bacteroidota bacterium]|jgi:uncharacterized membrane protein YoaK (UPF0700 family)
MLNQSRKILPFVVSLSFLAGFIDALGFMSLGGVFVSFMSGNTTRLGVGLSHGFTGVALIPAAVIVCFITGVFAGSVLGHFTAKYRLQVLLGVMSATLILTALLSGTLPPLLLALLLAAVMGVENTLFREGEINVGLTYMTGALVRMGQQLAAAVLYKWTWSWYRYGLLWLGLMAGALSGAACYRWVGMLSLWVPATLASGLCISSFFFNLHQLGKQ